jgi:hypothetical protein
LRGAFGILIASAVALLASQSSAHHAISPQFDVQREARFTGALTKLDGGQPHTFWAFAVRRPDGQVETWNLEGPSPTVLRRAGVRLRTDFKVGQTITVYYNPARDGSPTGYIRAATVNGRRISLRPAYTPHADE